MTVGFYVHTDMNFIATERKETDATGRFASANSAEQVQAQALGGAYDE